LLTLTWNDSFLYFSLVPTFYETTFDHEATKTKEDGGAGRIALDALMDGLFDLRPWFNTALRIPNRRTVHADET